MFNFLYRRTSEKIATSHILLPCFKVVKSEISSKSEQRQLSTIEIVRKSEGIRILAEWASETEFFGRSRRNSETVRFNLRTRRVGMLDRQTGKHFQENNVKTASYIIIDSTAANGLCLNLSRIYIDRAACFLRLSLFEEVFLDKHGWHNNRKAKSHLIKETVVIYKWHNGD